MGEPGAVGAEEVAIGQVVEDPPGLAEAGRDLAHDGQVGGPDRGGCFCAACQRAAIIPAYFLAGAFFSAALLRMMRSFFTARLARRARLRGWPIRHWKGHWDGQNRSHLANEKRWAGEALKTAIGSETLTGLCSILGAR